VEIVLIVTIDMLDIYGGLDLGHLISPEGVLIDL